jgi:hypothetical protein
LERQVAVLATNPSLRWCAGNILLARSDGASPLPLPKQAERLIARGERFGDFLDADGWGAIVLPSNLLIEAALLGEVGGWDRDLFGTEDVDLCYRIAMIAPQLGYAREACVRYRVDNPASVSKLASQSCQKVRMVRKALGMWNADTARDARARRLLRARAFRALLIAASLDGSEAERIDTRGLGLTLAQRACLACLASLPLRLRRRLEGRIRDLHRSWAIWRYAPAPVLTSSRPV